MNNQNKKRTVIASITSLVLCVAMLLGTTFAWFTAEVSNDGNRIKAGTLGVELWKYDTNDYINISTEETQGNIFTEDTLWEPAHTEIVFLQVKNTGSLALNYNILLDIVADAGNTFNLADVLDYAIVPGAKATDEAFQDLSTLNWVAVMQMGENGTIGDAMNEDGQITAAPNGALLPEESDFFALAVHMDDQAGNEYQECGITIGVDVVAVQMPDEQEDSGNNENDNNENDNNENGANEPVDVLKGLGNMDNITQEALDAAQTIWSHAQYKKNNHGAMIISNDDGAVDGTPYMTLENSDECHLVNGNKCGASHDFATQFNRINANIADYLEVNKAYTLKFWIKQSNIAEDAAAKVELYCNGDYVTLGDRNVLPELIKTAVSSGQANQWHEISYDFTTPSEITGFIMYITTNAKAGVNSTVSIDNIRIYAQE